MFVLLYKLIPLKPLGYRDFGSWLFERIVERNRFTPAFLQNFEVMVVNKLNLKVLNFTVYLLVVTPVVASLHLIQREITMEGTPYQYVALLRGINVGGHTLIKMADLRKLFESFGLTDVVTYIQTGNVLFSTNYTDAEQLAQQLEKKLASSLGNKMTVFVLSPAELRKAAAHNPFNPECLDEEQRCHLMFLSAEPDEMHRKALMTLQGEEYRFHIQDKVMYYVYSREHNGNRRTINFEKVLGVIGTSRSWKVINKLIELSS